MQAWALLGVPWPPGAPKHPSFRACTVIKKGPGLTPMATSGPHPKDCVVLDTVVGLLGLTRPLINSGTRETITLGPGAQSTPIGRLLTTQLSVLCAPHPVSSPPGGVPGGHRGRRDELRAVETPARTQPTEAGLGAPEGPVCPACRRSRDSPVQTRRREKPHAAPTGARAARPSQHGHPASGAEERRQRPLCQREGQSDQGEEQEAAAISGAVAVGRL